MIVEILQFLNSDVIWQILYVGSTEFRKIFHRDFSKFYPMWSNPYVTYFHKCHNNL